MKISTCFILGAVLGVGLGLGLGWGMTRRAMGAPNAKGSSGASSAPSVPSSAKTACPDIALGETTQDCPWAGVARALVSEAEAGRDVAPLLEKLLPDLRKQLKADSKRAAWKKLWGTSINFDEYAQGVIVHPAILKALGETMRIPFAAPLDAVYVLPPKRLDGPVAELKQETKGGPVDGAGHALAHAGLEHTYGYLFSLLKTPFGYKRARWVDGAIALGFGLPEGLLSPRPSEGSLFANVTYFAGKIAFRDEPAKSALLDKGATDLPRALRSFDFAALKPVRLEETVTARDETGDARTVVLRTDLVPFKVPGKNSRLLVYSVKDPSRGGTALITAFPVEEKFESMVLKPEDLGEGKEVKARYNAYVEGVSGKTLTGSRKVLK